MGRSGFWIFIVLIVAVVATMIYFAQADLPAPDGGDAVVAPDAQ